MRQESPESASDRERPYGLSEIDEALKAVEEGRAGQDEPNQEEQSKVEETGPTAPTGTQKDESKDTLNEPVSSADKDKVKPSAMATFHRQQREFQQKQQAFAAEKAEVEKYKAVIENAKEDRLAALELLGYTDVKSFLDSIVEDGGRMTPERRELRKLQKWREEQEKTIAERETQAQEQQKQAELQSKLDALRSQVQNTITSDAYKARLVNLPGSDEQVMREMDALALETGAMPKVEDAIERVETKFLGYLEDMASNPRVQAFFEEKLRQTKLSDKAPSQSKSRGNSRTIGSETRSPGLKPLADPGPSEDGDREMQEAIAFLRSSSF